MLDWYELSESTPGVFDDPRVQPQGQDGTPFFSYYDDERSLSFIWDGKYEQHVLVSHGGAGEPDKWSFDFLKLWRGFVDRHTNDMPKLIPGFEFSNAAAHFMTACVNWIEMMENDSPPEDDSLYEVCFEPSNKNWTTNPTLNLMFIKGIENWLQQRLRMQGHVFLNEVYDALGFSRTSDGAIKGWLMSAEGDRVRMHYPLHPEDPTFWITFEPDGVIYDQI